MSGDNLRLVAERCVAAMDAATESGKGITDDRLRRALERGEKGTLAIVPVDSWVALSNEMERLRSALDGSDRVTQTVIV